MTSTGLPHLEKRGAPVNLAWKIQEAVSIRSNETRAVDSGSTQDARGGEGSVPVCLLYIKDGAHPAEQSRSREEESRVSGSIRKRKDGEAAAPVHGVPDGLPPRLCHALCPCRGR
jgi:hypothetical protein